MGNTLGREAPHSNVVQEYVKAALETPADDAQFRFAVGIAAMWIEQARGSGDEAVSVLRRVLEWSGDAPKIVDVVWAAYSSAWHAPLPQAEASLVCDQLPHFVSQGAVAAFLRIVGGLPYSGWETFTETCALAIDALEPDQRKEGFRSLVDSVHLAIRKGDDKDKAKVNKQVADWILDQLLLLPDIDNIGGNAWWHLRDILGRTDRPGLPWLVGAIQTRIEREPSSDDQGKYKVVPTFERLTSLIKPISPDAKPDEETRDLVSRLMAHIDRRDLLSYYLPQYVHDVDPHGLIVPGLAVEKLETEKMQGDFDAVYRWARFGGVYAENSEPWRWIARAALRLAPRFEERDRVSLMNALTDPRVQSYSSAVGEVATHFISAVEAAKTFLEKEEAEEFLPYRQWRLRCAEADLQREQDEIREDRGD